MKNFLKRSKSFLFILISCIVVVCCMLLLTDSPSGGIYTMAVAAAVTSFGSITEDQIADLKAKYTHIKVITVIVEPEVRDNLGNIITPEESYHFAVRRPDRGLIKMLMPLAEGKEIDEFADKAVKNLVVAGDMDALEDGIVYMGVVQQLKDIISPSASFLSNA